MLKPLQLGGLWCHRAEKPLHFRNPFFAYVTKALFVFNLFKTLDLAWSVHFFSFNDNYQLLWFAYQQSQYWTNIRSWFDNPATKICVKFKTVEFDVRCMNARNKEHIESNQMTEKIFLPLSWWKSQLSWFYFYSTYLSAYFLHIIRYLKGISGELSREWQFLEWIWICCVYRLRRFLGFNGELQLFLGILHR